MKVCQIWFFPIEILFLRLFAWASFPFYVNPKSVETYGTLINRHKGQPPQPFWDLHSNKPAVPVLRTEQPFEIVSRTWGFFRTVDLGHCFGFRPPWVEPENKRPLGLSANTDDCTRTLLSGCLFIVP